jgi:pimeloyl-ACP methyl ester carboxylesterase
LPAVLTNETPAKTKRLAVFVHGFMSSPACWDDLLTLLRSDDEVLRTFELECFQYKTGMVRMPLVQRFPRVAELGHAFGEWLERQVREHGHRDITLVGHSQGGLVIQSYLVRRLRDGRAEELKPIRQVLLIATPNLGSTTLSPLRKLTSLFLFNSQEYTLRVLNPEIGELMRDVRDKIVGAASGGETALPIPVQCFWGQSDNIVTETSALGSYTAGFPIPGDHGQVIRPSKHKDERYEAIRDALLRPIGHRHVFDIESYEVFIRPQPLPTEETLSFDHYGRTVTVQTDNKGRVDQTVTFSAKNRCNGLFVMRYGTMNRGAYVKCTTSHDNAISPQELNEYELHGTTYAFGVRPRAQHLGTQSFTLRTDVYGGFSRDNQQWHFHLTKPNERRHYWKFRMTLDLTACLGAPANVRYMLGREPMLYLYDQDPRDHRECARRQLANPQPALPGSPPGIWRWEISDVGQGVVDIVWDLADLQSPSEPAGAGAQP